MYEQKENIPRGALFLNLKKEKQNQPDMRGNIEFSKECIEEIQRQVNMGVEFPALEIVGWSKVGPKAGKYLSLKAGVKRESENMAFQKPQVSAPASSPIDDDSIPF